MDYQTDLPIFSISAFVKMGIDTYNMYKCSFASVEPLCCRLPDRHSPVRHPKVRRDRFLATNTPLSPKLRPRRTKEDSNVQHTGDTLDDARQGLDLPHAVLAATVLAGRNVGLGEEGFKRRVDDEEVLVAFQRTFLGGRAQAHNRVDTAELPEFSQDPSGGDGSDFDGYVFPVREETGL